MEALSSQEGSHEAQTALAALNGVSASQVASIVSSLHPQMAAVLLSRLQHDHAAQILLCLDKSVQTELLRRLAVTESVSSQALSLLNGVLQQCIDVSGRAHEEQASGDDLAKKLAALMSGSAESSQPLSFEGLLNIDAVRLQDLLPKVAHDTLVTALKICTVDLLEYVLAQISQKEAYVIRIACQQKNPVILADVLAAQREIVAVVSHAGF